MGDFIEFLNLHGYIIELVFSIFIFAVHFPPAQDVRIARGGQLSVAVRYFGVLGLCCRQP